MMFGFSDEVVCCWDQFVAEASRLRGQWVFRGGLSNWRLESSFDRVCRVWRIEQAARRKAEQRLVREFQRHPEAHNLGLHRTDYLGWFALMQHHGAPTRLLDWTYSPFVAAFFALEAVFDSLQRTEGMHASRTIGACVLGEPRHEPDSSAPVVWALDAVALNGALDKALDSEDLCLLRRKKERDSFKKLFVDPPPKAFVSTATPLRLNERLSAQQGLLLCPGDVSRTWEENLEAVPLRDDDVSRRKFVMKADDLEGALVALRRMNISRRSLFPGLDGYARSIGHRVKFLLELPVSDAKC